MGVDYRWGRSRALPVVDFEAGRGALSVEYKADNEDVVELDDYHQNAMSGDADAFSRLLESLSATYGLLLDKAHKPSDSQRPRTYNELFQRYQRRPDRFVDRVAEVFRSRDAPLRLQQLKVDSNPLA